MNIGLQNGLLIGALGVLALIIWTVSKKKLNLKYSIVWILWALLALLMAIFPQIFYEFAHLVGIEMPVNAVFLIMIALLYALVLFVYCMISKHNEEIIQLTYELSSLRKELDELKKKNEK